MIQNDQLFADKFCTTMEDNYAKTTINKSNLNLNSGKVDYFNAIIAVSKFHQAKRRGESDEQRKTRQSANLLGERKICGTRTHN